MSGEIKQLRQPASPKRIGDIDALEWFKCRFDGKPYVAMVVASTGSMRRKTDAMLLVNGEGGIRPMNVDTFQAYGGEFLGYLTTEEHVTIHGSLDPDWAPPEPVMPAFQVHPDPTDRLNLDQIPLGVPFYYRWHADHMDCVGIKLPRKYSSPSEWYLLRWDRNGGDQGFIPQHGYTPRVREFVSYVPPDAYDAEMARLRKHKNANDCIWE